MLNPFCNFYLKMIETPTADLDSAINEFLQIDINRLISDSNSKILPSFVKHLDGKPLKNVSKLYEKVGLDEGIQLDIESIENTNMIVSPNGTIVYANTTANYTIGNAGGMGYISIICSVDWSRDASTYDILSLYPTTTTGYFFPNYMGKGYEVSEQEINQGYPDRAYVHKCKSVWNVLNGQANSYQSGYLLADIVVRGNSGTPVKKYAYNLSVQLYEGFGGVPGYQWGY